LRPLTRAQEMLALMAFLDSNNMKAPISPEASR
jgi:hypothetical protein